MVGSERDSSRANLIEHHLTAREKCWTDRGLFVLAFLIGQDRFNKFIVSVGLQWILNKLPK